MKNAPIRECPTCHKMKPLANRSDAKCVECQKARIKEAAARAKAKLTPQKRREYYESWRARHAGKDYLDGRSRGLKKLGLTLDDYDRMYDECNRQCVICGGNNKGGNMLNVDAPGGVVRGLLCIPCRVNVARIRKYRSAMLAYIAGDPE